MKSTNGKTRLALMTGAVLTLLASIAPAADIYHTATTDAAFENSSWGNGLFGGQLSYNYSANRDLSGSFYNWWSGYVFQTYQGVSASQQASVYLRSYGACRRFGFRRSAVAKIQNSGFGAYETASKTDQVTFYGSTYNNMHLPLAINSFDYKRITSGELNVDIYGHTVGLLDVPGSVSSVASRKSTGGWETRAKISGTPTLNAMVTVRGQSFRRYLNAFGRQCVALLTTDIMDQTPEQVSVSVYGSSLTIEVEVDRVGQAKLCDLAFPTDLDVDPNGIYGQVKVVHGKLNAPSHDAYTANYIKKIRDAADELEAEGDFTKPVVAKLLRQLADRLEIWIGYQVVVSVSTTSDDLDWSEKAAIGLVSYLADIAIPVPGAGYLAGKFVEAFMFGEQRTIIAEFGIIKMTEPGHTELLLSRRKPVLTTITITRLIRTPIRLR